MELNEKTIFCRSCNKPVLQLLDLNTNFKLVSGIKINEKIIECSCIHCGDKSWKTSVKTEHMISPIDGQSISNISTSLDNNVISMFIEIIKL